MPLANLWLIHLQGEFPILRRSSCPDHYLLIRPSKRHLALFKWRVLILRFIRSSPKLAMYNVSHSLPLGVEIRTFASLWLRPEGISNTFLVLLESKNCHGVQELSTHLFWGRHNDYFRFGWWFNGALGILTWNSPYMSTSVIFDIGESNAIWATFQIFYDVFISWAFSTNPIQLPVSPSWRAIWFWNEALGVQPSHIIVRNCSIKLVQELQDGRPTTGLISSLQETIWK